MPPRQEMIDGKRALGDGLSLIFLRIIR